MAKVKSKKQVGFLLSKGSPLTPAQQNKLKAELHSGSVTVSKKPKKFVAGAFARAKANHFGTVKKKA